MGRESETDIQGLEIYPWILGSLNSQRLNIGAYMITKKSNHLFIWLTCVYWSIYLIILIFVMSTLICLYSHVFELD